MYEAVNKGRDLSKHSVGCTHVLVELVFYRSSAMVDGVILIIMFTDCFRKCDYICT